MKPKALIKTIVGILVIGGGMVYLMYQAAVGSMASYYQVSEFFEISAELKQQSSKVAGHVKVGSIEKNLEKVQTTFVINDKTSELPVQYIGTVPDNFTEDIDVVVQGKLGDEGIFEAKKIITKCDSKYEKKVDK